jgi:hypothetical protein
MGDRGFDLVFFETSFVTLPLQRIGLQSETAGRVVDLAEGFLLLMPVEVEIVTGSDGARLILRR